MNVESEMPAMTKLRSAGVVALAFPLFAAIAVRGFAPPSSPSSATVALLRAGPFRPSSRAAAARRGRGEGDAAASTDGGSTRGGGTGTREGAAGAAVSNKLLAETIAPFRGLRLFFYGAFASGALAGGLITLSGVVAASNGLRPDIADLNAECVNLAVDFGAVTAFGLLAKFDIDRGAELDVAVEERVRRKGELKKLARAMRERESVLGGLSVSVRVSADGETRAAPVAVVRGSAGQHLILVAGPGRAVRDALRGAQLNRSNFAMTNVLVVPFETSGRTAGGGASAGRGTGGGPDGGGGGGGFGADSRPSYETQAYVAEPVGDGWEEFVNAEIEAAVEQAGEGAREDGIALVVANDGRVLRRGVGKVPWRQMVNELEEAVTGEKKEETSVPFLEYLEE